jgi:hypothetical protein
VRRFTKLKLVVAATEEKGNGKVETLSAEVESPLDECCYDEITSSLKKRCCSVILASTHSIVATCQADCDRLLDISNELVALEQNRNGDGNRGDNDGDNDSGDDAEDSTTCDSNKSNNLINNIKGHRSSTRHVFGSVTSVRHAPRYIRAGKPCSNRPSIDGTRTHTVTASTTRFKQP